MLNSIIISLPGFLKGLSSKAYLVGGSVRDLILGLRPMDYDLAVDGNPRAVADSLAQRIAGRVVGLGGRKHTLHRVVAPGKCIDISKMRGSDITADLNDRDFCINALACPLDTGRIIDPAGGLQDLYNHTIRMLKPQVFDDDPLRLLRAHRLAACLEFNIDAPTRHAISQRTGRIREVAGERIWNELEQIMATLASRHQVDAMSGNGLLTALFPELIPLKACTQNNHHAFNAYDHSLAAYTCLETIMADPAVHLSGQSIAFLRGLDDKTALMLKLSILLHDVGKPACRSADVRGRVHFYGHADHGAVLVKGIAGRLRLSTRQSSLLEWMVRRHHDPLQLYLECQRNGKLSPRARARFFRKAADLSPALLIHALADEMGKASRVPGVACQSEPASFLRMLLASYFDEIAPLLKKPGLLNGRDLMQHFDLRPSPFIGELLEAVETAQLAGELHNREEALSWVASRLKKKR